MKFQDQLHIFTNQHCFTNDDQAKGKKKAIKELQAMYTYILTVLLTHIGSLIVWVCVYKYGQAMEVVIAAWACWEKITCE